MSGLARLFRFQVKMCKKYPDIIPLVGLVTTVSSCGIALTIRAAVKFPDVSWAKTSNPEPWNMVRQDERTKLLPTVNIEYANRKHPAERPSMATETYKDI